MAMSSVRHVSEPEKRAEAGREVSLIHKLAQQKLAVCIYPMLLTSQNTQIVSLKIFSRVQK